MARTFVRQATQIRKSDAYDDTITPSATNYETNPVSIEDDLNSIRSQLQNLINRSGASFPSGNWYDDLSAPGTFENGSARGVQQVNQDLHDLEHKRVLVTVTNLTDVTVGSGHNYVVLSAPQLPSNTKAAIGSVTTLGTVVAYNSSFGSHSLANVAGSTNVAPKNLCEIVSGSSRDPILSDNRVVYALFQSESNTDGSTMSGTSFNRAQLSFVRINSTGDDLEAVPYADIEGKQINYASIERKTVSSLNEQDFLRGAMLDNLGSSTNNRQTAYDNQGTVPVELTTNATLDLNSAGIYWEIRDLANASLFKVTEGSTGGTSTLLVSSDVDTLTVSSVTNNFTNGASINTASKQIQIGVTDGVINTTSTNDLRVLGAGNLYLDDGNQAGSTWAQTSGIKLSSATSDWDTFETNFGEVSLLEAINAAYTTDRRTRVYANVTSDTAADTDVSYADSNLDAALPNLSKGTFVDDYDVYLNGELLRPGANSSANNDYYPGSSLSGGKLKFEFGLKTGDVICLIAHANV